MGGLNPGVLREIIAVHSIIREDDERGGDYGEFAFLYETSAKVTPMKPLQSLENGRYTIVQPYEVMIRYSGEPAREITAEMKIDWKGRLFVIQLIGEPDPRDRKQKIVMTREL